MRAARIHEFGDASVIRIDDIARPAPGPGQVLIRVAATSFNPTEVALRTGVLRDLLGIDMPLPLTLGWDVAGTVAGLGDGVDTHAVGDRVVGMIDAAAAEFAVADASAVVTAPGAVPLADAAALPLAGLTAWQLIQRAGLAGGERVLVNGAGGGIGGFAVRIAKSLGAQVIATASPRSAAAVRRQGADQVVDYTTTPLADAGRVDVVVNLVALEQEQAAALVDLGGRVVSATNAFDGVTHVVTRNDTTDLATLVDLVDRGVLTVDVSERHPLDELATVHRRSEAGDIRGKIVIRGACEADHRALGFPDSA
jgi:NADPH:quinone reductase-like Zn-dependent oxidoreductase